MGDDHPKRHKLLDQESQKKLPQLYATEDQGLDAEARVKFFTPDSNWTWYASEFDGEDIFYGLVIGHEIEFGYFSLSELEQTKGPLGLPIERDRYFEPRTLKELKEAHLREQEGEGQPLQERLTRDLTKKVRRFAKKLAEWDKRIAEIIAIGSLPRGRMESNDTVQLACTFDPEPEDHSQGFFSIANLLVRNEQEHISERLGIMHGIDLGFQFKGKVCLPDGEVMDIPAVHVVIWSREDERRNTK